MTRTRYNIFDTTYPYFVTCTTVGWVPVFTRKESVEIVFESWRYLRENNGFLLYGYVILENHLHIVAAAPELPTVLQRFKSFTAREIVQLLEKSGAEVLLRQLRALKMPHKKESSCQVWQEGSKPIQITNSEVMRQKLEYIHRNPVERGYVDDPVHWRYSSARDYAGRPGPIPVDTTWF